MDKRDLALADLADLADLAQEHIDDWIAGATSQRRYLIRYFLTPDATGPSTSQPGQQMTRPRGGCPNDVASVRGVVEPLKSGAGTLWQLGVHPALQSCGVGTLLISSAEARITARGLAVAELGVEESNPRARALYERLGYRPYGRELDSWDVESEEGTVKRYETMCTLMRKDLT
ncbi:GNAT family N-acetyltransferase [Streptomyces sp. MS06]|uniref:GNAT family N-acetyltransferase n=1 Tax=Streptomyces sp. MS06 TaxID=3385974 RepID=UPI0039A181A8